MLLMVKKILKYILIFVSSFLAFILVLATYILVDISPEEEAVPSHFNSVNDVTQLNPILVEKVISPKSIQDIQNSIRTAKGKISIGGGRYSQGGQTALDNTLHLDMRQFNQVVLFNPSEKEITVQSGIRWRDILDVIDPERLSIKIMQSYSNFTVGGSLSVNVHGRYMGEGPIIRSVKSIKVVLADGSIVDTSPNKNSELFYGFIGEYGGLGVIAEVTLELVPNIKVARETHYMKVEQYTSFLIRT
jgi:FAD/FMN-containing dehydrogenase